MRRRSMSVAAIAVSLLFVLAPFHSMASRTTGEALPGQDTGPRADEPVVFLDVTNSSGLGWGSRSRVAWGDFNGDGWDDLLFRGRELWRNNGDGTFHDVTVPSGVSIGGARGGVWGDYDNDGDLDIYQLHGTDGDDRLLRNEGDGTFQDVTYLSGEISDGGLPTEGAAWGDYDNDGHLDLYVANYEDPPNSANGTYDVLYHNNGDGTFSNVTAQAGMLVEPQCGRGVAWADYNDDGYQDIYVANYRLNRNFLWRNNGDGTFTDVAEDLGVEGDLVLGYYGHSIGATWGDIDNDGDMDLFVANLAHPRFLVFSDISKLYINTGPPNYNFQDVPIQSRGIAYEETHSDPSLADYDNDGDLDLFITSVYDGRPTFLYRNDGDGTFTDVTADVGTVTDNGWGSGWGDYDNDGFLDLSIGSGNSTKFKLFGNGGNHNHWFEADLKGTTSNAAGIGARVELEANATTLIREVNGGRGTTSQDHIGAHFGLGDWAGPVNITIMWPSGIIQRSEGLDGDQKRVFVEPPAMTDFSFVDVEFGNDTVLEGDNVTLRATVTNRGTVKGNADIELFVSGFGIVGTLPQIRDLEPLSEEVHLIGWNTSGMGGDRTVYLDLVQTYPEDSDEANNEWSHRFYINSRPVAIITSIEPPVAYQERDRVTFQGQASDDGYIMEVEWRSSLDGLISKALNFTMDASNLSTGVHKITFRAKDNVGTWSGEASKTLMIEPPIPPEAPIARIISIEPTEIREGDMVEFEGEGSDQDGRVVGYRWESSIDGILSEERKFRTSSLSAGDHVISFIVMDDDGLESEPATWDLEVEVANTPPTAVIELISPNPADEGENVRFQGRGVDKEDQVVSFIWTSDLDGILSYDYNFVTSDLSVGTHRIGLKVKDTDGVWSEEVFGTLEILPVNEVPTIEVDDHPKERSDRSIRVKGTAKDTDGRIVVVEIRIGAGTWRSALTTTDDWSEWYYDVDTTDLGVGVHRVFARAFDGEDRSEEVFVDIEVEEDVWDVPDLWDLVIDTITGENLPCLIFLILIVLVLAGAAAISVRRPKEDEAVKSMRERYEGRRVRKVKGRKKGGRKGRRR